MSAGEPAKSNVAAGAMARQFLTYNLVGIIVAGVDFLFFTFLSFSQVFYLNAHFLSRTVGGLTGFILHRNITFRLQRDGTLVRHGWRFMIVYGVSFALSSLLLIFWVQVIGFPPLAGKALAEAIVVAVSFFFLRHWGFR